MSEAPPPSAFTPRERALVRRLDTPTKVQRWLETISYNKEEDGLAMRSFRGVVRDGTAHCLEAAIAAAAILEQHGRPPTLLHMWSRDLVGHACLLVRAPDGRWGAVSRSSYPGLHGRKAAFRSVRDLVWSFFDPFVDLTGEITGYAVVDLREVRGDWRLARGNVWRVERALLEAPHTPLRGSRARVARWRRFYRAHWERHGEKPRAYPGRERWL